MDGVFFVAVDYQQLERFGVVTSGGVGGEEGDFALVVDEGVPVFGGVMAGVGDGGFDQDLSHFFGPHLDGEGDGADGAAVPFLGWPGFWIVLLPAGDQAAGVLLEVVLDGRLDAGAGHLAEGVGGEECGGEGLEAADFGPGWAVPFPVLDFDLVGFVGRCAWPAGHFTVPFADPRGPAQRLRWSCDSSH